MRKTSVLYEKLKRVITVQPYEIIVYTTGIVAVLCVIWSVNLLSKGIQAAIQMFNLSVAFLVLFFLGWQGYKALGEPINYQTIDKKYFPIAFAIVFGIWAWNVFMYKMGIYQVSICSTIPPQTLFNLMTQYLAPLFLIFFAIAENLFFVVVIPILVIRFFFGKTITEATLGEKIIAAIIAGFLAAIFHLAWKPVGALINTFLYFFSWALATLLIRSPIIADMVHALGNALGWLYVVVNPELIVEMQQYTSSLIIVIK